jgi:hypothetical protein
VQGAMKRLVAACVIALVFWLGSILPVAAQIAPIEITRADVTKLDVLDASKWTVLGVRLGDTRDAALKTLQALKDVKTQEDPLAGRIYVIEPPTGTIVVMSLKLVEDQVTTINIVGGFREWLQGDTKLLFKAFEDDSLRHKILGREDNREAIQGGTKEAPSMDLTYAYFKEGILLHSSARFSTERKQMESQHELVLIFPARQR